MDQMEGDNSSFFMPEESKTSRFNSSTTNRYVPVCLCIKTESEYHDIYRPLLLEIYETLNQESSSFSSEIHSRLYRFSDIIVKLAYINTVLPPVINT